MLLGKVLAPSVLLLLLVVLVIGQEMDERSTDPGQEMDERSTDPGQEIDETSTDPGQEMDERSTDPDETPAEEEESMQARNVGCRRRGKITIEDINKCRCTKLLVSGDVPRPDSSMRASSQWDHNHGPRRARIYRNVHGHLMGSWSSRPNNIYQWLQFDLGQIRIVTGVVTKGRALHYEQFVKTYKIRYSRNGATWYSYKHKVFQANFDTETPSVNTFYPAIKARYIRFNPRSWHNHISMRADVLGCL